MALVSNIARQSSLGTSLAHVSVNFNAMGSQCEIQVYIDKRSSPKYFIESAIAEVRRIEDKYSRYKSTSVVSYLNKNSYKRAVELDSETLGLLTFADVCYRESEGRFDLTSGILRKAWNFASARIPYDEEISKLLPHIGWEKIKRQGSSLSLGTPSMELDFGGIGKEYAADRAAAVLAERGVQHGFVNLAGDIAIIGSKPCGSPWSIGITDPQKSRVNPVNNVAFLNVVRAHSGGIATSGVYERCIEVGGVKYSHLLNALTGRPVQGFESVTVVHDSCLVAGAISTIAILLEDKSNDYIQMKLTGGAHIYTRSNSKS